MPVHTRGRGVASPYRLREVRAWLRVREAKAKSLHRDLAQQMVALRPGGQR